MERIHSNLAFLTDVVCSARYACGVHCSSRLQIDKNTLCTAKIN